MMIAKRILLAVAATMAVAAIAISIGVGGHVLPAWAQDILPPAAPAPPALGNPTNLTATTGGRGEVSITFKPAMGATVHWVWRVKPDNTGGALVKGEADGQQTVTGLTPGQAYYFIVIAGRPQATGSGMQWSSWSNWGGAVAGAAAAVAPTPVGAATSTPTPTPTPTRSAPLPANPVNGDYDADDDHLIEIRSITQLDAIRHDLDGDGAADDADNDATAYAAAFPNAAAGMGCPSSGCEGYELANNLDFGAIVSGAGWVPIGYFKSSSNRADFYATFDGNGHTISNLYIGRQSQDSIGLFGAIGSGSNIQRVGLLSVYVVGANWVGGLVGNNNGGTIIASYVTGTVEGSRGVGGLAGWNGGAITASYATATVASGSDYVGGLVGRNGGAINASYATGTVSHHGSDNWAEIGGFVGSNNGTITSSYTAAAVSTNSPQGTNAYGIGGFEGNDFEYDGNVNFSYWDTEASGLSTSWGGLGKTTTELQSPTSNTGIYARWDPSQWDFGTSTQYPVLKVEGLSVAAQRGEATAAQPGGDSTTPAAATDRAALVALYEATGGSENRWVDQDGWPSGASLSQWYGVTTNADGRVTELNLSLNNLTGPIPSVLVDLTELERLDLSANELTGPIPRELEGLENLTYLNLIGNELDYSDGNCTPPELRVALANAYKEFRNERASLRDSIGEVIQESRDASIALFFAGASFFVEELESINPDWGGWNDFVDASYGLELPPCARLIDIPEEWPDFESQTSRTDAQALWAIRNYYANNPQNGANGTNKLNESGGWTEKFKDYARSGDADPDCPKPNPFATRPRLLRANENIHGVWTEVIDNCHRVVRLDLDKRALVGGIPPAIGRLGQLKELNLSRNVVDDDPHRGLSGQIPPELGHLTNLRKLALNHNQLDGEIPAQLGHLTNMKFLDLSANGFNGVVPLELGNMTQLEHLKLDGTKLKGCLPPTLRQNIAPSVASMIQVVSPGKYARLLAKAGKLGKKGETVNEFAMKVDALKPETMNSLITEPMVDGAYTRLFASSVENLSDASISKGVVEAAIKTFLEKIISPFYSLMRGLYLADIADNDPVSEAVVNFIVKALNTLSEVLTPIDKVLKPGSTAGFSSLGGVSLNCSGLLPSPQ